MVHHNWISLFSRTFWTVALIISFLLCSYVLYTTFVKWQYEPEIGSMRKPRPVQTIPFPTVTICPQTKTKKSFTSFENSYRRRFEDEEIHGSSYMESIYFETLLHVCDPQLVKYHTMNYSVLSEDYNLVPELQNMLYTVDDAIMLCKWRESLEDCSQLFNDVFTDQGVCFSFNMLDHNELFNDDMWVWRFVDKLAHNKTKKLHLHKASIHTCLSLNLLRWKAYSSV